MNDVIQCPTCSKKFRLPATPPATFTCTSCATVMDLSGFQPAAAAAAAPAAARSAAADASSPMRSRAGGAAPARPSRKSGAGPRRGRRGRDDEDGDDDERGGRGGRQKKDNTALLLVCSLAGVLVIGGVAFVMLRKKDDPQPPGGPGTSVAGAPAAPPATGTPAGTPPVATPPPEEVKPPPAPKPPGTSGVSQPWNKVEIKTYPHMEDTNAEEQNLIDQAVQNAIDGGGRDAREAEVYLVKLDVKSVPALISEFKKIQEKHGLEGPEGLRRAMVVDRTLRKIDGVQERKFKDEKPINVNSDPKLAQDTIKRWNWWWDTGAFKTRQKPWDPREDEKDSGEDAAGDK